MALIKPDDGHDHGGIKFNNEEDAARFALEETFKLARLGDPSAQYAAALAILHVADIPNKEKEAEKWLRLASAAGYVPAKILLKDLLT